MSARSLLKFWNGGECIKKKRDLIGEISRVPWFWTDQYDVNLQVVGVPAGSDRTVTRGDSNGDTFIIFHMRDERLVGAEMINCGRERRVVRQLIAQGRVQKEAALADTTRPLNSFRLS